MSGPQNALQEAVGASVMAERDVILGEGGAFASALRRAEAGAWPSPEMLADLWRWALWLVMVRGYRGATTGARYVSSLARWGGWCAEHGVDYQVATLDELDAFTRWLYAGLRLSASSRAVTISSLRSFYGWRSSRRGGRHCAHDLRVPKRAQRMPRKYSPAQLRALFGAISKGYTEADRIRDRAVLLLLYATGIRREELVSLRLTDVQIESRRIATVRVHGKGAKERIVAIEGPVVDALGKWLDFRLNTPKLADGVELFCGLHRYAGWPLQPEGLERIVKRCAERAGVTPWGVHMFRITFATQLYDDGVDLERIRIALGHESIETTRGYIAVANRQRSVRLPSHRQHNALGSLPEDLPGWAKQLESQ